MCTQLLFLEVRCSEQRRTSLRVDGGGPVCVSPWRRGSGPRVGVRGPGGVAGPGGRRLSGAQTEPQKAVRLSAVRPLSGAHSSLAIDLSFKNRSSSWVYFSPQECFECKRAALNHSRSHTAQNITLEIESGVFVVDFRSALT